MHRRLTPLVGLAILAACSDSPLPIAGPEFAKVANGADGKVSLCHIAGSSSHLINVSIAALGAHLGHGDYIGRFTVDPSSSQLGDGIHFARIGEAIAAARAIRIARDETTTARCRITIAVAAGTYHGATLPASDPTGEALPLVIDFPDLTLQGALDMQLDAIGRATGLGAGDETVLTSVLPLQSIGQYSEPLFVINGHPDGSRGDGAEVRGFVFQSGHVGVDNGVGGVAVIALRVTNLAITGNRIEPGFSEGLDLRASDGVVERNQLSGGGNCDVCFAGPGSYRAEGNRLLAGGIPGFFVVPTVSLPVPAGVEPYTLPVSSLVTAAIVNNEVRDHQRTPVGAGIRVGAVGTGAPDVVGSASVEIRDNALLHNRFGLILDAAFPVANTTLRGDLDVSLANNILSGSCQNDLLVSLSRHTTGLGLQNAAYLLNSTYRLSLGGNLDWADAWYANPAGYGNTLVVDGAVISNGSVVAYDASKVCP